ncbi:MAG: hypothetical protein ACT4NV_11225 [Rhodoferax sp.]
MNTSTQPPLSLPYRQMIWLAPVAYAIHMAFLLAGMFHGAFVFTQLFTTAWRL